MHGIPHFLAAFVFLALWIANHIGVRAQAEPIQHDLACVPHDRLGWGYHGVQFA